MRADAGRAMASQDIMRAMMRPGVRLVAFLFLAALAILGPAAAAGAQEPEPGVLWEGKQAGLGVADIAAIAAPALWFSADEPFILAGDRALPHAHPCDTDSATGVVYYQVTRIRLRGGDPVGFPPQDDPFFLDRVGSFTIRYFLYFRKHFGSVERNHDLEAIDIDVVIEPLRGGGHRLRVARVAGLARGTQWYANELQVGEGTKLPITMFVEEGTHATGPDRNADGLFTPGHDINRRIKDAWGIRDIEAGTLVSGGFEASMFKARQRGYRVLPPDVARPAVDNSPRSSTPTAGTELGRYELRAATNIPVCARIPPNHRELRLMMEAQRFGPDAVPDQYRSEWLHDLVTPLAGTNPLIPYMAVRWDRDQVGGSVNLRGLEMVDGYLLPRFTFATKDISIEALFTPSGARMLSWYVSAGAANENLSYLGDPKGRTWRFVAEGGVRLRIRVSGIAKLATLGSEFAGMRLGVRSSGFDDLKPIRFVIEIGIGGW
jgi:hypothetical protein